MYFINNEQMYNYINFDPTFSLHFWNFDFLTKYGNKLFLKLTHIKLLIYKLKFCKTNGIIIFYSNDIMLSIQPYDFEKYKLERAHQNLKYPYRHKQLWMFYSI